MEEYKYFAFISYSHKDKKEARALFRRLEYYRLPGKLVDDYKTKKNVHLPKKLVPVFIDDEEMAKQRVSEGMASGLDASRFLIVVCSPNSARSEYVNHEVQHFIEQGRRNHIIPYIIEGVPCSGDPETECYPEAMRDPDILGADAQALKGKAALRVIATMLGVNLGELVQREKQRFLRRLGGGVLAGLLALSGAVMTYRYYNVPVRDYYANYTEVYGLPVGVGEKLSKRERQEYVATYCIERLAGKVVRLRYVDLRDNLVDPFTRFSNYNNAGEQRYTYVDGKLYIVDYINDGTTYRKTYTSDLEEATFRTGEDKITTVDPQANMASETELTGAMELLLPSAQEEKKITGCAYVYDEQGHVAKEINTTYNGATMEVVPNGDGDFGYERLYNKQGLLSEIYYLDADQQRIADKDGCYQTVFSYNDRLECTGFQNFQKDGRPVTSGAIELRVEYEKAADGGTEVRISTKTADGVSDFCTRLFVNKTATLKEIVFFRADGVTPSYYEGTNTNEVQQEWETDRSYVISFWDETHLPAVAYYNGDLCHKCRVLLDQNDRIVETRLYSTDGTPMEESYIQRFTFDRNGNQTSAGYFGDNGPAAKNGFHMWEATYDDRGNQITFTNLDVEGKRCRDTDGICEYRFSYNNLNQMTEKSFYDPEGKPILNAEGVHKVQYQYNFQGDRTQQSYFGVNDEPVLIENGYHMAKIPWENGKETSYSVYGLNNEPVLYCNEFHREIIERTKNTITYKYYGIDNEPILDPLSGAYISEYRRKAEDTIQVSLFGINQEPMIGKGGYHMCLYRYNDAMQNIEKRYYGLNGEPILIGGAHKHNFVHDANGRVIEQRLYGTDEKPISDEFGVHRFVCTYDERGNQSSESYYGVNDEPALLNGAHKFCHVYDAYGHEVERSIYGTDGNAALDGDGVHKYVLTFDENGNRLSLSYYGIADEPIININGAHEYIYVYDENGERISRTAYDVDGNKLEETP